MARRPSHSFSQLFPARKTSTLRFHRCGSHILKKPPLVPRLGLHHPSPKVGIIPSFPSAPNIHETGKITCYLTKPTHISHVLCAVHMITHSTNKFLGSLAGHYHNLETVLHKYSCILAPSSNILLLGSTRLTNSINMLTNSHG
jgi:hypothetical protein